MTQASGNSGGVGQITAADGPVDGGTAGAAQALWRGAERWSAEEAAFEHQWNTGARARQFNAGAWSASGLLRRLGLFHNLTAADAVTGYKGLGIMGYEGSCPVSWCVDIIHRSGIRHRKHNLIEALTDAAFGLPVSRAWTPPIHRRRWRTGSVWTMRPRQD